MDIGEFNFKYKDYSKYFIFVQLNQSKTYIFLIKKQLSFKDNDDLKLILELPNVKIFKILITLELHFYNLSYREQNKINFKRKRKGSVLSLSFIYKHKIKSNWVNGIF